MKNGFSLVELLISLIVISCITAAFSPLITKKFTARINKDKTSSCNISQECSKFNENCILCSNDSCIYCNITCPRGKYKDIETCTCKKCNEKYGTDCHNCNKNKCTNCANNEYIDNNGNCKPCSSKFANCTSCDEVNNCLSCETGYILENGKCEIEAKEDISYECTIKFGMRCVECDSNKCTKCTNGYTLKSWGCESNICENMEGCLECTIASSYPLTYASCILCANGYKPEKQFNVHVDYILKCVKAN